MFVFRRFRFQNSRQKRLENQTESQLSGTFLFCQAQKLDSSFKIADLQLLSLESCWSDMQQIICKSSDNVPILNDKIHAKENTIKSRLLKYRKRKFEQKER